MKKIPKRNIIIRLDEFRDFLSLSGSRSLNEGCFIKRFEDSFKKYIGAKEAIAVSSGRFALYLILRNLGLKEDDKIILSAYNFKGVPKALLKEGFCPVFVDADRNTYQIDIEKIEKKINKNTKAIIATHLFGQPCGLNKILDIARRNNLFLIEDAAHSLGSYYHGKHTGTMGDAGFFSFTGSKMLNTSFGGMIVTDSVNLADKIRVDLFNYDFPKIALLGRKRVSTYIYALMTNRVFYSTVGYPLSLLLSLFNLDPIKIYEAFKHLKIAEEKMRFTNFQALIGLKQMGGLNVLIAKRKMIARALFRNLHHSVSLQKITENCDPNYFMVSLKTKDKYKVFKKLLFRGIDSNLNYASDCSYLTGDNDNPEAKSLSNSILTINLPFDLKEKEICYIGNVFNEIKDWVY